MELNVELTPRTEVPRWMRYGAPVVTILAALFVSSHALARAQGDLKRPTSRLAKAAAAVARKRQQEG